MRKKVSFCVLVCLFTLVVTGCRLSVEKPVPEGISNPDGGIVSVDPMIVQGQVKKLSGDRLVISVQAVEWELSLSESAQKELETLKNAGIDIGKDDFVQVYYEEKEEGGREAIKVERLRVN